MATKDVGREVARLRAEIDRHNRLYYVEAAPEVTDREFDRHVKRTAQRPVTRGAISPKQALVFGAVLAANDFNTESFCPDVELLDSRCAKRICRRE